MAMRIDIWSDFTCPWCYVGKMNLDTALKERGVEAEYVYHSFQTVPQGYYPAGKSFSIFEVAEGEGMTKGQALQRAEMIEQMGRAAGVVLNMKDVRMTDTTNAHRCLQLAGKYGCQDVFMMASYRAVFTEDANIGDSNVLKRLAVQSGIPEQEVEKLLESDLYLDQVRADIVQARERRITGVPYFLLDGESSLYGSQPVEAFAGAISNMKNEDMPVGASCSNGSCAFPN